MPDTLIIPARWRYTEEAASSNALKDALDSVFRGIARECEGEALNVEAAVAEAFAVVEEALTQLAHASRLALLRLVEIRDAGLDEEVSAAIRMLGALEDMLLDAAEDAADHSARPIQRELLKHVLAGRTEGTRVGVIAATARRDVAGGSRAAGARRDGEAMESRAARPVKPHAV